MRTGHTKNNLANTEVLHDKEVNRYSEHHHSLLSEYIQHELLNTDILHIKIKRCMSLKLQAAKNKLF